MVRKVSFVRFTKYSRKLYELKDCEVRNMLWYKLRIACRLGVPTADMDNGGFNGNMAHKGEIQKLRDSSE